LVVLLLLNAAAAEEMTWFKATEILQRERLSGEECARVMKRYLAKGDKAALSRAELDYEAARGEFNAVVAGLQAALTDDKEKPALQSVEERVRIGSERRRAFCSNAESKLPAPEKGKKGWEEVAAAALDEVIQATTTVWKDVVYGDKERRDNLRTALEDVKWPKFSDISP
jgi:hypothetical protein